MESVTLPMSPAPRRTLTTESTVLPPESPGNGEPRSSPIASATIVASIATAAVIPAVLLGGLVLADPNSFAVPRTASIALVEPHGQTLQVYAEPLRPGNVNLHLYLEGVSSARVGFRSIAMSATSQTGARAKVTFYDAGIGHEIAEARLTRGAWAFHIAGVDGAGRPLRGSFAVSIN